MRHDAPTSICVMTQRYTENYSNATNVLVDRTYPQNIVSFVLIADETIDIKSWIISLSGHLCPQDEADIVYGIAKNKNVNI